MNTKKKLINVAYVGGPIDLANPDTIARRDYAHKVLNDSGITTYNPSGAFKYGGGGEVSLKRINDYALSVCDVILLIFEKDVMTIGTSVELQIARDNGRLLVVVSPWDITPCYIIALADQIFKTQEEALNFIVNIVNNKPVSM